MTVGAIMSGYEDLEFSLVGYIWMGLNCVSTAGYTLYLAHASKEIKLPKFGMVFYNNLLSVVLLFPFAILRNELPQLFNPRLMQPGFIIANTAAGLLGFYLNFASLWCVGATSATTYAIVGSVNKVPITIAGFVLFDAKITEAGLYYVVLGKKTTKS